MQSLFMILLCLVLAWHARWIILILLPFALAFLVYIHVEHASYQIKAENAAKARQVWPINPQGVTIRVGDQYRVNDGVLGIVQGSVDTPEQLPDLATNGEIYYCRQTRSYWVMNKPGAYSDEPPNWLKVDSLQKVSK